MAAPVLSKKDQTHTLASKGRKPTVKTVLCTPYINRWPHIEKTKAENIFAEITRVFTELKLGRAEEHQLIRKHRGTKAERKNLLEEYMNNLPNELINLRSQLVIGVKAVTRLLERGLLRLIVVNSDSDPLLHRHLVPLSAVRGVPALALPDLTKRIGPLITVTSSLVAFGLKVRSEDDCEKLDSLVNFISDCAPTISLDWFPKDEVNNVDLGQSDSSASADSGLNKDVRSDQENSVSDHGYPDEVCMDDTEKPAEREDYSHLYVYKPKKVQGFSNDENIICLSQDNDSDYIEDEDNVPTVSVTLSKGCKRKEETVTSPEGASPVKKKKKKSSYKSANLGKVQSNQQKIKLKKNKLRQNK